MYQMWEVLFWIYLSNSVLIIIHEIDSAFWQEWKLFGMKGGVTLFLILHFPLLAVMLWGLRLVIEKSLIGLILSLVISIAGITGFIIHITFIARGRKEFKVPVSLFILSLMLVSSLAQAIFTTILLFR